MAEEATAVAAAMAALVAATLASAADMPDSVEGMAAVPYIPSAVLVPLPVSPEVTPPQREPVSLAVRSCMMDFAGATALAAMASVPAAAPDGDIAIIAVATAAGAVTTSAIPGTVLDTTIRGCGIGGIPIRPTIRTTTIISPSPTR